MATVPHALPGFRSGEMGGLMVEYGAFSGTRSGYQARF